jgi:hypothetical protein
MKNLIVNGKEFKAEKIIKNDASIIGKNGDVEVFSFRGVSDFSGFVLSDNAVFDIETSSTEKNRADIDYLALMMGVSL